MVVTVKHGVGMTITHIQRRKHQMTGTQWYQTLPVYEIPGGIFKLFGCQSSEYFFVRGVIKHHLLIQTISDINSEMLMMF